MVGRNGILWNDMNNKLLTPKKGFMKSRTSPPRVLSPKCCIHLWPFFFSKIDPKVADEPSLRGLQTRHWQNLGSYGKKQIFGLKTCLSDVWCFDIESSVKCCWILFLQLQDNLNFSIIWEWPKEMYIVNWEEKEFERIKKAFMICRCHAHA